MVLLSLIAPPLAPLPVYPPGPPEPVLVCCHCKRRVTEHRFKCDSHSISSFHCRQCGDTLAIPSAVVNRSDPMTDVHLELSSPKMIILDRIRRIADCIQRHGTASRKTMIDEVGCLEHQVDYVLQMMRIAQLIHKIGPDHHPLWKLSRPISECDLEAIYQPTLRAKARQGELNAETQRLLETLRSENLCSKKDLMGLLGVAEHTITRQLSLLKVAGLVGYVCARNGAKHWYAISPEMESEAIVPSDGKPIPLDSEHLAWMREWREFGARRLAQQQWAIAHG